MKKEQRSKKGSSFSLFTGSFHFLHWNVINSKAVSRMRMVTFGVWDPPCLCSKCLTLGFGFVVLLWVSCPSQGRVCVCVCGGTATKAMVRSELTHGASVASQGLGLGGGRKSPLPGTGGPFKSHSACL